MSDILAARERRSAETSAAFEAISTSSPAERLRIENRVVIAHIPLAESIARRYRRGDEDYSDLKQVALLGLVKAARHYDPGRGTPFVPYAVPTIDGELKRHIRDHGWLLRPGRQLQELCAAVTHTRSRLAQRLGREPDEEELAGELGVSVPAVRRAHECLDAQQPVTMPARDGEEEARETMPSYQDLSFGRAELRAMIAGALRQLSAREVLILRRRFIEERTQAEIGHELGVSQMQVSRLLTKILAKLREELSETFPEGLRDAA